MPLKLSRALSEKLQERAEKEGVTPSFLASALVMNYALKNSREARVVHAALFPQGEEAQKFVEDGDRSHLRALVPAGRRWHPSNLTLLGSAAAEAISSLGYAEELNQALSLRPEDCSGALSSLMERLTGLAEKGKLYDETKKKLDSAAEENGELKEELKELEGKVQKLSEKATLYEQAEKQLSEKVEENKQLKQKTEEQEGRLRSLQDQLDKQEDLHKKETEQRFAELNKELAEKRKQIEKLSRQASVLRRQLESVRTTEMEERNALQSLRSSYQEAQGEIKAKSDELTSTRENLKKLQDENAYLLTKYWMMQEEIKKLRQQSDERIASCEKAKKDAELLAEKRRWAVGPLSVALSVTAKEADPQRLSWDAEEAVKSATRAALEEEYLKLPENLASLQLPKKLNPKYALAYWTGLFDYASARFIADAVAEVSAKVLGLSSEQITANEVKAVTEAVDAAKARADKSLSNASAELFGSYVNVNWLIKFPPGPEAAHDTASFAIYADSARKEVLKKMEDVKKLAIYAVVGKKEMAKFPWMGRTSRQEAKAAALKPRPVGIESAASNETPIPAAYLRQSPQAL